MPVVQVISLFRWQKLDKSSPDLCLSCTVISRLLGVEFREVREKEEGGEDKADEVLAGLRSKRGVLSETLSRLEVETREILLELLAEFDRRYSDIAEVDRGHYTTYFATVSLFFCHLFCLLCCCSYVCFT